jgi:hypothetical protein
MTLKNLRLCLIYLAAKVLRVPIRVGDDYWLGFTERASSANSSLQGGHSSLPNL